MTEIMDRDGVDPDELREDLRNLEIINTYFGGRSAVVKLFHRFTKRMKDIVVVDLATGYGDHPRSMATWAAKHGKNLRVVAVDRQNSTLKLAREASLPTQKIFYVQADVRRLPFKPASSDLVFCSLALHHFSESDAVTILRESARVARRGMACMDLLRSRAAYWAVWLLTQVLLRAPMTRHDARLSVRRAFTAGELKKLAQQAGWSSFWHKRLPWFRQAVGCEKEV